MEKFFSYIPLCWINGGNLLVCNRKSQLLVHDIQSDKFELIGDLPLASKHKLFMHFSLAARALRLVNFTSISLDEKRVLFAYRGRVYLVDLLNKEIKPVLNIDKGKRPLFFCHVKEGNHRTKAGIYYGDYCGNPDKEPINILYVDPETFEKRVVYTFEKGKVNHIHNVVFDEDRDCIWVFSGDFGDAAAIWRTNDSFKTLECVLKGDQDYRADVVTIFEGDIWYATDAPFAPNHLMRLYEIGGEWMIEKVAPLNGPVIYGGRMGDKLVFSTDVESDGIYKNRFEALTSRKLGNGIKDYNAYVYAFDLKTKELKVIYQCKKDILPFVVFQFGAIMFPGGCCDGRIIPAFHVALNKYPLKTLYLNGDTY